MPFTVVDPLLLIILIFAVWDGRRRGFAPYATELLAFGLAIAVALFTFAPVAQFLLSFLPLPQGLTGFGIFATIVVAGHALVLRVIHRVTGHRPDEPSSSPSQVAQLPAPVRSSYSPGGHLRTSWSPPKSTPRTITARLVNPHRPAQPMGAIPAAIAAAAIAILVLNAILVLPGPAFLQNAVHRSALGSNLTNQTSILQQPLRNLLEPLNRDSGFSSPPCLNQGDEAFCPLPLPDNLRPEADPDAENHMLDLVNRARAQKSLPALVMDPQLQTAAREHSLDMYSRKYFSHRTPDHKSPFDRMAAHGIKGIPEAENIAFKLNVDDAEADLMLSPAHRANILDPQYRRIGIGIYRAPNVAEMFTQDFAT